MQAGWCLQLQAAEIPSLVKRNRNRKIGRILHLKSEIPKYQIGPVNTSCSPIRYFGISDLRSKIRAISKSPTLQVRGYLFPRGQSVATAGQAGIFKDVGDFQVGPAEDQHMMAEFIDGIAGR